MSIERIAVTVGLVVVCAYALMSAWSLDVADANRADLNYARGWR